MSKKTSILKKEINVKTDDDLLTLVEKKKEFFKDIIQKTIINLRKNQSLEILGLGDITLCVDKLADVSEKIKELDEIENIEQENLINKLQFINNELSGIIKNYGTQSLEDLLLICFGNNIKILQNENEKDKFLLLKKYFHPTSYNIVNKKNDKQHKNKEIEDNSNLDCHDISNSYKQFHMKVYGIKIYIYNEKLKKNLVIFGILDNVVVSYLNSNFIKTKQIELLKNLKVSSDFNIETFNNFIASLNLKDYLIMETIYDISNKFVGYITQYKNIKQKQIYQLVKEYIGYDTFSKRETIINLLIKSYIYENQYLAYLLYDLLSNDSNGSVDTHEQSLIYDSLPWSIKQLFAQSMKKTIHYTNELSSYDVNKIPLEQQICLLKVNDAVKEKAMMKLKEVKAKNDDTGSKARQYLDGLLKIPFKVYNKEPILNVMDSVRLKFKDIYNKYNVVKKNDIPNKEKYTSVEILKYIKAMKEYEYIYENNQTFEEIKNKLLLCDKKGLNKNIKPLYAILKDYSFIYNELNTSNLSKNQLKDEIENIFILCKNANNKNLLEKISSSFNMSNSNIKLLSNVDMNNDIIIINNSIKQINDYMLNIKSTLDTAVYGHDKAKKQIERIIGQWINGEQHGYCFGFEGPPGVGKTSLAKKGISECLKDDKGMSRPFAMIQMGGDSNGSTLSGHNYTYVGSTWGSIVQILIDKKCMNPIIFIDEIDKISRTEQGKEIVGILTHLLDPAQNDCFQDKYFTGVDLDLSKALFILSYNDADAIDKILLDRVHRIHFNSLMIEDKLIICRNHIFPEVYSKMGLENIINFSDEVIKFIIEEYTLESGVRKLKEIIFEIVGDINLNLLKNDIDVYNFPIEITICDIKNNYFKDKREIIIRKVPEDSMIGYANGMYATSLGNGGTLPMHAKFFPSEIFLELKLTGLQQDVMRESMHVSLTVAWNLTSEDRKKQLRQLYDGKNNKYGINVHPGDGSVQKDGPSAGGIITVVLYSLLNGIPIKAKMAMTGEIQMSGDITAIGGLNYKILGSIKAGIKEFIYPKENKKEFDEFFEKYKNNEILNDIKFYEVSHIKEALELLLEK